MLKSTAKRKVEKPSKPYPDFPLFPHATGRWAKKIRGKFCYFGPWDDADAALQRYLDQKDDLHAGRTPRVSGEGLTLADLCNRYLNFKRRLHENGELASRSFKEYFLLCEKLVSAFGKNRLVDDLASDDFEKLRSKLAKNRGPVSLGNDIGHMRMIFKYAYDAGLIEKPIRFGQSFNKPSRSVMRKHRAQNGKKMFEADEIRKMLQNAGPQIKAMVLLGINCGFGNADCGNLSRSILNLESGWIDYPRPKTGVERRCPLWPETIAALKEAIEQRPQPSQKDYEDLVFLTVYGNPWVRITNHDVPEKRVTIDAVSQIIRKLLNRIDLNGKRNFYCLRHTFETIGGESRDQVAVNALMGHIDSSMAGVYRERISDERLQAVTDTVRGWLWPEGGGVK